MPELLARMKDLEDLQFGMMDLLLESVEPDLPREDQAHALLKSPLHEAGVEIEPFGDQGARFIGDRQLEGHRQTLGQVIQNRAVVLDRIAKIPLHHVSHITANPTLAWAPTNQRCSTLGSGRGGGIRAFGSFG